MPDIGHMRPVVKTGNLCLFMHKGLNWLEQPARIADNHGTAHPKWTAIRPTTISPLSPGFLFFAVTGLQCSFVIANWLADLSF
jgi:hypothetical protein